MFTKNYKTTDESFWNGRIDSLDDFYAYRWHQWIERIDLTDEKLTPYEDKLGIGFIGFCSDEGIKINNGRVGAFDGPKAIRKKMANLPCCFSKDVKLFDAGDIINRNCTLQESQDLLAISVEKILDSNLFPILLGGGHEIAFGHYNGVLNYLKKHTKKPNIGIINFDAHFDLRPYDKESSSGTMFRQISDICIQENIDFSYFCIGIQKHSNTLSLFKTANELNTKYILAEHMEKKEEIDLLNKLRNFISQQEYIYITICSDVLAAAYAPGVSAPQPLGITPQILLKYLKYILKSKKVISFDIAEISPKLDIDNMTSNLAASIIYSLVDTLCKMK
ncbi:formimidoylglutamase [Clostridiisalibacter paucivorans]|uniref:formimidoylglutamase n=1 Tax=Clostridiisalibacter paucivorans TaxID=408753 RepID=UPI00047B0117|nr:formimidoylglutamase [Clostridiisalibacter paucivorans]